MQSFIEQKLDHTYYPINERIQILKFARRSIIKLFAGKAISELERDADILGMPAASRVNVTLRHAGRIRGSMSAPGVNLGCQIIEAVYRAALDQRFGACITRAEIPDAKIEVWIQTGSLEVSREARLEKDIFLLGIEGLEVEGEGKSAYYKPSVAITSKSKTPTELFSSLCLKAGLEKNAWISPNVYIRKTQWICIDEASNIQQISRNTQDPNVTSIQLDAWIRESASYLVRNQDINGDTAYLYDPIADLFASRVRSQVRASGCIFALSQVLQSSHGIELGEDFKAAIAQMARGLLSRTLLASDGRRIVQEENACELPKVGATALLAAALGSGSLRDEFYQEYEQLYQAIALAQKLDGRFITRFGAIEERANEIDFFSGQALLVLALEAERGNIEALEMCKRAFQPYVDHFRKSPATAFVGWHVDVWSRIAMLTKEQVYANFAFEQTDWLLHIQIKNHSDARWIGGFSKSGSAPNFSSIVFSEATARSLLLAHKLGDNERSEKYRECVKAGLRFCEQLRLEDTPINLLGNPERSKGGIALGLVDRTVRCDVVQHFITLCLVIEQLRACDCLV
jgi:AMMECR1 domain-containing protein